MWVPCLKLPSIQENRGELAQLFFTARGPLRGSAGEKFVVVALVAEGAMYLLTMMETSCGHWAKSRQGDLPVPVYICTHLNDHTRSQAQVEWFRGDEWKKIKSRSRMVGHFPFPDFQRRNWHDVSSRAEHELQQSWQTATWWSTGCCCCDACIDSSRHVCRTRQSNPLPVQTLILKNYQKPNFEERKIDR